MGIVKVITPALTAGAVLLLGGVAVASGPSGPYRAPAGIYVEVGGGVGWYPDTTWGGALGNDEQEFNSGAVIRGAVGMRLPGNFRGEIEGAFRRNSVDECDCDGVFFDLDGRVRATSLMANLFYDFKLGRIQPFVGAGIGWAHLNIDTNFTGFNFVQADGTDDRFAYQLMAGVAVPLSDMSSVTVRYTFFDTVGDTMTAFNTGVGNVSIDAPYSNHSVTVGLRFGF